MGLSRQPPESLKGGSRAAVAILLVFPLFEYLRLHDVFPILGALKVQTAIFGALLLIVITETAKGSVRLARQSWLLLCFLSLAIFTILPATNQYLAYLFAYTLTLVLIVYFAIIHILKNEHDARRFLSVLVCIHIYVAIKGILGYAGSEFSTRGYTSTGKVGAAFLGDENDLALAMVLVLPFAVYLFRQTGSLVGRLFWGLGALAILLCIIFTFSRGGFIGLTIMVLYWIATSRNKRKSMGVLAVAVMLLIAVAPAEYWARVETITNPSEGTAGLRRNYWAAARRMFVDSPIWGVGGLNYNVLVPQYADDFPPELRDNQWGKVAHSTYFQLLAEFGLLGALLVGSLIVRNFSDLKRAILLGQEGRCSDSVWHLADVLRVSWVGLLVCAAFVTVHYYPHLYYLTALTIVVHRVAVAESEVMEIDAADILQGAK